MPSLSDILSGALDTISAPGRYSRGALAGRPGQSMGGRDMLEAWGALAPNTPGLDWGDAAGFLAEAVVDPLNLIPVGALGTALGLSRKAVPAVGGALRAGMASADDTARLASLLNPSMLDYELVDDIGNNAIRSIKEQGQYMYDQMAESMARTGEQNIVNRHSGLKRFAYPDRATRDIDDLRNGQFAVEVDPAYNSTAAYVGSASVPRESLAAFSDSVIPPVEKDLLGNVLRSRKRKFRISGLGEGRDTLDSVMKHEASHYLTDYDNVPQETVDYINQVVSQNPSSLAYKLGPRRQQYAQHWDEVYSRVEQIRDRMRAMNVPMPHMTPDGNTSMLEEVLAGAGDLMHPGSKGDTRLMQHLVSNQGLAELLKNLATGAAVATPVGAAIYGNGQG